MKKVICTLFLAAGIFMAANIQAQEKMNVIKTSLTSIFFKTYVLDYERVLNEDMGLQLGFYYTGANSLGADFSGFAITPEFRYYLSGEKIAPNGAFVAPYLRYQNFSVNNDLDPSDIDYAKATLSAVSAGLIVGVQRTFKETITLSAFIGPAYYFPNLSYEEGSDIDFTIGGGNSFVWGRAGINIGFMF